ncbi:MAG: hypothetical protein Ct9H90mP20_4340 [Candidatus Neomarinimicrobiota bacterium]|nr:MAG: hypothetical protein Ct9H90mP20_4340 [Candidatus Neomarinimicrobiota bacterium]
MTYYGRWSYKYEEALRRGAAGAIVIHEPGPQGILLVFFKLAMTRKFNH